MSQGPVSGQCSPAPTQRRQEPSSPTVPVGKCLSPKHSTRAALTGGQGVTGSSRALGHLSLCSFACRSLSPALHWNQLVSSAALQSSGSPFPPSHPSCLPPLLVGISPAVTTSPLASSWIPLCAPGVPFPGCCPPGWSMGVPQFPPGSGKWGDFAPPQRLKGRAASQVLPAQESPFRSPPHPWKHAVL